MKVVLALGHGEIPPHLHFREPNPHIPWADIPVQVVVQRTPFVMGQARPTAGVSSFGLSGTNAHVVVQAAPSGRRVPRTSGRSNHIFTLSAETESALRELARRYEEHLSAHPDLDIADLCYTANCGRNHFQHRLALIVRSTDEVRVKLASVIAGHETTGAVKGYAPKGATPNIGLLVSGAGSSYAGMGRSLYDSEPVFRRAMERCDEISGWQLAKPLLAVLFGDSDASEALATPTYARVARFALAYALAELWKSWGIQSAATIADRSGESVAACVSGGGSVEEALRAVMMPARAAEESSPELAVESAALAGRDCQIFLELGPEPNLIDRVRAHLGDADRLFLSSLRRGRDDTQQMFESLGGLYGRGASIDWDGVYREHARHRVLLPTYPFERQRYWLEPAASRGGLEPSAEAGSEQAHPLLGHRLRSAGTRDEYELKWSTVSRPEVARRRVHGFAEAAAAVYAEMAIAAATLADASRAYAVAELVVHEPIVLADGDERIVHFVLGGAPADARPFEILGLADPASRDLVWTRHVTGTVREAPAARLPSDGFAALPCGRADSESADAYLRHAGSPGTAGGPQPCRHRAAVCDGRGGTRPTPVQRHAAIGRRCAGVRYLAMSAALDVAGAVCLGDEHQPSVWHTRRIGVYRTDGDLASAKWVHVTARPGALGGRDTQIASIRVYDGQGGCLAGADDVCVEPTTYASLLSSALADPSDWSYRVEWRRAAHAERGVPQRVGPCLILGDDSGVGVALARLLEERGERAVVVTRGEKFQKIGGDRWQVDPREPDHFRMVLDGAFAAGPGCGTIVHLWSLDSASSGVESLESLEQDLARSCGGALHVLQAVAQRELTSASRVWLVTRGAQVVGDGDGPAVSVSQTPLWAMGQVLGLEHPTLLGGLVDLDAGSLTAAAMSLFREITGGTGEQHIAFRAGGRYVARLRRCRPESGGQPGAAFHRDATYLICGGLGGLGLRLSTWMAGRGARHLVLASRGEPSASAHDVIEELRRRGVEVVTMRADVSRRDDVQELLDGIAQSLPPLRGVFHLAAVLDDGVLLRQTWERFARVLAPKVAGAWNLHTLTEGLALDHFVLFSSLASLVGNQGQANYAVANGFLDGLAHRRQATGRAGLSINWGQWPGVGLADSRADARPSGRLRGSGIRACSRRSRVRRHGSVARWIGRAGRHRSGPLAHILRAVSRRDRASVFQGSRTAGCGCSDG